MFVKIKTFHRKKIVAVFALCMAAMLFLIGRLGYLMLLRADYYSEKAQDLHERERSIKAARGKILDCNGKVLADNKTVCTISVIHSQIKEPEKVIDVLTEELGLERNQVKKRVEKNSSIERIKTNVDKQTGDKIREYDLAGVKVDEDYKRNYPYGNLASKVLGFTGSDNQGIVGLEVKYESILKGTDGQILTMTDARGVELSDTGEGRKEPVSGKNLILSLDANLQEYAQQAAYQALEQKQADSVSIILMRPGNGEILAMVNVPEYDLNDPFNLKKSTNGMSQQEIQDERNKMWRNGCINDTYEPGSTFKIITASAALEEGVVTPEDTFSCPGFRIVDDRRIRCHKTTGHGSETFVQGVMNSCNPVFIEVGQRLGTDAFYRYFQQFGLLEKTGIDLPGEAETSGLLYTADTMGEIDLATNSFGQNFNVTMTQMVSAFSSLVNGGYYYEPHVVKQIQDEDGNVIETKDPVLLRKTVSSETSKMLRQYLKATMDYGTGTRAKVEGYDIGAKTGTAEKLPRGNGKYLLSYIGYAPQNNPEVVVYVVIDEPNTAVQDDSSLVLGLSQKIMSEAFPYLGITTIAQSGQNAQAQGQNFGNTEYTDYDENYEDTYGNADGSYVDENYTPDLDDWASSDVSE